MLRRQNMAGSVVAGASSTATGGKESSLPVPTNIVPFQSSFTKVQRWQQANFAQPNKSNRPPPAANNRDVLQPSPDSLDSQDSDVLKPMNRNIFRFQQAKRYEQQEREARLKMQKIQRPPVKGKRTPPMITVEHVKSLPKPQ
jgi:hypothetical protein